MLKRDLLWKCGLLSPNGNSKRKSLEGFHVRHAGIALLCRIFAIVLVLHNKLVKQIGL
jgi:hypothetical protein